jgi:serine/threonine-protein kinase
MSDEHETLARARVGRVLDGKWRLERLLGVGGMAAVYEGLHRNASRAAIKILHPEFAADPEVRERFLREGYAANRVEHPSVVRVIDDDVVREGEDAGAAFLVMELLEGESLFGRMQRLGHALREEEALAVAEPVLDVLAAAHANGVIHRDLKPDNVFLVGPRELPVDQLTVKVLDFGIARMTEAARKTRVGTMLGTLSYMPPEQARGASDLDGRADLYALGATMFRALTGRRVHDAKGAELLTRVATTPAPAIRSVYAGVGESVAWIVDRALRFQRVHRYPDADAMRADVRAARAGEPLPSSTAPWAELADRGEREADATTRTDRAAFVREESTRAHGAEPPTVPARAPTGPTSAGPASARAEPAPTVPGLAVANPASLDDVPEAAQRAIGASIVAAAHVAIGAAGADPTASIAPAAPGPAPHAVLAPPAAPSPTPALPLGAPPAKPRRRWLVPALLAIALLGAATVALVLVSRADRPAERKAEPAPTVEIDEPSDEPTAKPARPTASAAAPAAASTPKKPAATTKSTQAPVTIAKSAPVATTPRTPSLSVPWPVGSMLGGAPTGPLGRPSLPKAKGSP